MRIINLVVALEHKLCYVILKDTVISKSSSNSNFVLKKNNKPFFVFSKMKISGLFLTIVASKPNQTPTNWSINFDQSERVLLR